MLASACFGDDGGFAESAREDDLAQPVVDLVTAGVVEVFAFQPDACSACVCG